MKNYYSILLICLISFTDAFSQTKLINKLDYQKIEKREFFDGSIYKESKIDIKSIKESIKVSAAQARTGAEDAKFSIQVPNIDQDDFSEYVLKPSRLFPKALQDKYPGISVYEGYSKSNPSHKIRLDIGYKGINAIIYQPTETVYLDAIDNEGSIKLYKSSDYKRNNHKDHFCEVESSIKEEINTAMSNEMHRQSSQVVLRNYRIAIATTGEYSTFHGGTVETALSAVVTTLNRVTGIYERDVAVTFTLVDNNDQIIYLNADTDPYTNNSGSAMLTQNVNTLNSVIGASNYDIGHVFSTGGGGVAYLRSVCTSNKAGGVTGLPQPINDPFDIDYVAHEVGHQFGGNHTFNGSAGSCGQWNQSTAMEPGSGVSIMAYAGICGSHNIANQSIAAFHIISIEEITTYTTTGNGNNCAEQITIENSAPIAELVSENNLTIPANTPFMLAATASDANGDVLSYSWEQYDIGAQGAPNNANATNGPIFRSFLPSQDSFRVFPKMENVLAGTTTNGEVLPVVNRELNFKLTVRDNNPEVGGKSILSQKVFVETINDDFKVTAPLEGASYVGFQQIEVKWDVAGTNATPFNATAVDVWLAVDGFNFDSKIASNVPNSGYALVTLPNINSTEARIMVKASESLFFQVNPGEFSITESEANSFVVNFTNETGNSNVLCFETPLQYMLSLTALGSFDEEVSLDFTYDNTLIDLDIPSSILTNDQSIEITVIKNQALSEGNVEIDITATSSNSDFQFTITVNLNPSLDITPELTFPANLQEDVLISTAFEWENLGESVQYNFQLSENADFTLPVLDVILNQSSLQIPDYGIQLASLTEYYWRVNAVSNCSETAFSETFSFVSQEIFCGEFVSENIPRTISSGQPSTTTSQLVIFDNIRVENIKVKVKGTHSWVSDLVFKLRSPEGVEVTLLSGVCGNIQNFDLVFDDLAGGAFSCPITGGQVVMPQENFNPFKNKSSEGIWTLLIDDLVNQDGGQLNEWSIDICGELIEGGRSIQAPSSVTVSQAEIGKVNVNWQLDDDYYDSFRVYRKTIDGANQLLAQINSPEFTYLDEGFSSSQDYIYSVSTIKFEIESSLTESEIFTILSNDEELKNELIYYPNPVDNQLTIKQSGQSKIGRLEVLTIDGRLLHSEVVDSAEITINMSSYNTGIYLVKLYNAERTEVFKIIKK